MSAHRPGHGARGGFLRTGPGWSTCRRHRSAGANRHDTLSTWPTIALLYQRRPLVVRDRHRNGVLGTHVFLLQCRWSPPDTSRRPPRPWTCAPGRFFTKDAPSSASRPMQRRPNLLISMMARRLSGELRKLVDGRAHLVPSQMTNVWSGRAVQEVSSIPVMRARPIPVRRRERVDQAGAVMRIVSRRQARKA
jgi:hypothetical protein